MRHMDFHPGGGGGHTKVVAEGGGTHKSLWLTGGGHTKVGNGNFVPGAPPHLINNDRSRT